MSSFPTMMAGQRQTSESSTMPWRVLGTLWFCLRRRKMSLKRVCKNQRISTGTPSNPCSTDAPAAPLTSPCEFNSCPSGSPAEGNNASMPRFNYVNSDPGDAMRHGIQALSPKLFGGKADIVVAGFNVGGKP